MVFTTEQLRQAIQERLPHLTEQQIGQVLGHYYRSMHNKMARGALESVRIRGVGVMYAPLTVIRRRIWRKINLLQKMKTIPASERTPHFYRRWHYHRQVLQHLWRQKQARQRSRTLSYLFEDPPPRTLKEYSSLEYLQALDDDNAF